MHSFLDITQVRKIFFTPFSSELELDHCRLHQEDPEQGTYHPYVPSIISICRFHAV